MPSSKSLRCESERRRLLGLFIEIALGPAGHDMLQGDGISARSSITIVKQLITVSGFAQFAIKEEFEKHRTKATTCPYVDAAALAS
jgi:hypothetical protein